MKKLMSLLVAVALVAFMTACGGGEETTSQDQGAGQEQVEVQTEPQVEPQAEPEMEEGQMEEGQSEEGDMEEGQSEEAGE